MKRFLFIIFPFLLATASVHAEEITREAVVSAVAEVEKLANAAVEDGTLPGIAIGIIYKDEIILARGFGLRETGKEGAIDPDTVFQLASVSKPVGSTVIAALVGHGVVKWDSRIRDLDPSFALSEPWVTQEVTIRDLYSHRSGLPAHAGDLLEDLGYSREEILHRLRYQKPSSSFRAGYAYTNFGLTEAAIAAAKAAGKEWEDLSKDLLYEPLGMDSTSSRYADFIKHENRARGHVQQDGKWVHRKQREPDAQTPAGGVSSSVNDMLKWMQLQLHDGKFNGKQIIKEGALTETHHPHFLTQFSPLDGLPGFYGLGWNVSYNERGELILSHSGGFEMGAATYVGLVPSADLGVVILTNASPIGFPEALGNTFMDLVLYKKTRVDWIPLFRGVFAQMAEAEREGLSDFSKPPASPTPPADPSAYTGIYENAFFGDLEIRETDGGLTMAMGPEKKRIFSLTHWNHDTFYFIPTGEMVAGTSGVLFTRAPGGEAVQVLLENLNTTGNGTFHRAHETGQ